MLDCNRTHTHPLPLQEIATDGQQQKEVPGLQEGATVRGSPRMHEVRYDSPPNSHALLRRRKKGKVRESQEGSRTNPEVESRPLSRICLRRWWVWHRHSLPRQSWVNDIRRRPLRGSPSCSLHKINLIYLGLEINVNSR